MSDPMQICSCNSSGNCEAVIDVPVKIYVDLPEQDGSTGGLRTWKSDWFDIASSATRQIAHNLNLEDPSECLPMLAARVKTAAAGWQPGEIIFADGANFNGSTGETELGWVITVAENDIAVSFGNAVNYVTNGKNGGYNKLPKSAVECRLILRY